MNSALVEQLLQLNQRFYADFAASFAESRESPQPGYARLLPYLPKPCRDVLDVGCGNGRFGRFLQDYISDLAYIGVDFTAPLLEAAAANVSGRFVQRNLAEAGALEGLGQFDVVACLATLQHIPGEANRVLLLEAMSECLRPGAKIFLANWQFMDSPRQRRKVADWSEVGVESEQLEAGDYLLTWQRNGRGLRYVHQLDVDETEWLAEQAGLKIINQFRSDGREGDLNLYSILANTH